MAKTGALKGYFKQWLSVDQCVKVEYNYIAVGKGGDKW